MSTKHAPAPSPKPQPTTPEYLGDLDCRFLNTLSNSPMGHPKDDIVKSGVKTFKVYALYQGNQPNRRLVEIKLEPYPSLPVIP
jgi:hypothetical protein